MMRIDKHVRRLAHCNCALMLWCFRARCIPFGANLIYNST